MNRFTALCFISGCLFGLATGRTVTVNGESIDTVVGRGSTAIPMVPELDALYTCKRLNIEPFDNCVEKLTHGHLHEDGSVKCCDTFDFIIVGFVMASLHRGTCPMPSPILRASASLRRAQGGAYREMVAEDARSQAWGQAPQPSDHVLTV